MALAAASDNADPAPPLGLMEIVNSSLPRASHGRRAVTVSFADLADLTLGVPAAAGKSFGTSAVMTLPLSSSAR